MISRREFVKGILGVASSSILQRSLWSFSDELRIITILHTNDTHSRIDPFPKDALEFAGMGGCARRATLIKKIREERPETILVDAGDVFYGTLYFNLFSGEVEFKAMSKMGYDIGIIGNHELDKGTEHLSKVIKYADFDFTMSNYEWTLEELQKRISNFIVREIKGIRIGFFGLGVDPEGLILPQLCKHLIFKDPLTSAKETVEILKTTQKCDFVVAITHLGIEGENGKTGDIEIAKNISGIDLIIGGHSHRFLENPIKVKNPARRDVYIVQVGHSGVWLGRVDIAFRRRKVAGIKFKNLEVIS